MRASRLNFIHGLVLVLVTLAIYLPSMQGGFIWDDDEHITANPSIVGSQGWKEIWTTSAARICPLTLTTFWFEHALWGLNAACYHLVNVLMHAGCAVMLWLVLRRLNLPGAWFAAALWAWHPVQVESVAWITELKNTQSGLFFLAAIFCFLGWRNSTLKRDYILAVVFGFGAMASKSSTVILPLVLALCLWWRDGRVQPRQWWGLTSFVIMSFLAAGLSIWTQGLEGANEPEWMRGAGERTAVAGMVFWFYLGQLLWPQTLVFIYPRWEVDAHQWTTFLPVILMAGVLIALFLTHHMWVRAARFAVLFYLAALLPVLGLVDHYFLRYSFVGDHFQYLASMGPLALIGVMVSRVGNWRGKPANGLWLSLPLQTAILLVCLGLTWRHERIFQSDEILWQDTIAKNPGSWMAQLKVGNAAFRQGDAAAALDHYRLALELKPDHAETLNNLAAAELFVGDVPSALAHYTEALRLKPRYVDARCGFATALIQAGRPAEAEIQLREALKTDPRNASAYYNLGNALFALQRFPEAATAYQQALTLKPDFAEVEQNLGTLLSLQGNDRDALIHYERALKIRPQNPDILNNLAWILATSPQASVRNGPRALELAQAAMRSTASPNPRSLRTLAAAAAAAGQISNAVVAAGQALLISRQTDDPSMTMTLQAEWQRYQHLMTNPPSRQP